MSKVIDYSERFFLALLITPFFMAFAQIATVQPYVVLLAISETLAVILILIRRPGEMPASAYATAIAFIGTGAPLLVRPDGVAYAPAILTSAMMLAGLVVNISAKLALNRSFGLVAANRGIKLGGPYRFVRHPMYLGYIITQAGFLLAEFTMMNAAIYAVAWSCQVLRIRQEEALLRNDPAYRELMERVPRKLIPGF
ncbi:methyltransferase family protein [Novosphingobium ginsenosidimutans]|nr:isoprenylcysteine carboxylmethyltransferase family protein [Novosphingobium ginsenosidimutans]